MSQDEKIYYASQVCQVTASRVVIGDKQFVLRNVSAVALEKDSNKKKMQLIMRICLGFGILIFVGGVLGSAAESPDAADSFAGAIVGAAFWLTIAAYAKLRTKEQYSVRIDSGGTSSNGIISKTPDIPQEIVAAINQALIDLDAQDALKTQPPPAPPQAPVAPSPDSDPADKILKFKALLDAGAITQEEFDQKKKQLLDL